MSKEIQFPKRRETDEEAAARVEELEKRRVEQDAKEGYSVPLDRHELAKWHHRSQRRKR